MFKKVSVFILQTETFQLSNLLLLLTMGLATRDTLNSGGNNYNEHKHKHLSVFSGRFLENI